jgi:hypothetical protein
MYIDTLTIMTAMSGYLKEEGIIFYIRQDFINRVLVLKTYDAY